MKCACGIVFLIASFGVSSAFATEPNETFATATVLSPGVLSVADELTSASFPDTVLGVRDHFGEIYAVDDDSSPLGDGKASGVGFVPTNSGSIDFSISGYPDDDFFGFHSESGYYKVYVDVYDFFDDLVDEFSELRLLEPGTVHDFSYSNFEWINGSYDAYIDNTVGPSDVDFFTFPGLTPGTTFTARTLDPDVTQIDTYLGWFDSGGNLLAADDDSGGGPAGNLSLLQGTVPANGMLTFAVTGAGDDTFMGDHLNFATYALELELDGSDLPGDLNNDGFVNAADYVFWRKNGGSQASYNLWRANFGRLAGGAGTNLNSSTSVPEPTTLIMLIIGMVGFGLSAPRQR